MSPDDVLAFWFGPAGSPPLANSKQWYAKDTAFDALVTERYGATIESAASGELDPWKSTPRGLLALVIVLDQFSRNAYRDTPRSFDQDERARELTLEALAGGIESDLPPVERVFLLMPLMHAEDTQLQKKSVATFGALQSVGPPDVRAFLENAFDYAKRHADIVERFGRFPHRNLILGRTSTWEEIEFMKERGSAF